MTARSCFDLSANDPKADIKAEAYWFTQMFLGDIIARVKEHIDHRIRPFLTQQERSGENEAGHRARQTSRDEGIVCKTRLKAGGIRWNWVYYSGRIQLQTRFHTTRDAVEMTKRLDFASGKMEQKAKGSFVRVRHKSAKKTAIFIFSIARTDDRRMAICGGWGSHVLAFSSRHVESTGFPLPPEMLGSSARASATESAQCAPHVQRPKLILNGPRSFTTRPWRFQQRRMVFFLPCFRFSLILRQSEIIGCLNKLFARVGQYWCFPLSFCPRCIDLSQYWVLGPTAKNRLAIICLKIMRRDRNGAIATCVKLLEMVQSSRTCARHVTVTFVSSLTGTRWFSLQLQFFSTLFTSFRRMVP